MPQEIMMMGTTVSIDSLPEGRLVLHLSDQGSRMGDLVLSSAFMANVCIRNAAHGSRHPHIFTYLTDKLFHAMRADNKEIVWEQEPIKFNGPSNTNLYLVDDDSFPMDEGCYLIFSLSDNGDISVSGESIIIRHYDEEEIQSILEAPQSDVISYHKHQVTGDLVSTISLDSLTVLSPKNGGTTPHTHHALLGLCQLIYETYGTDNILLIPNDN